MDTSHWKINLWMLWLSQLLVMAGFAAMIPFIPLFIKNGLGITNEADLAFYVAMFNFFGAGAYAVFVPVWGVLSDRFGVKPMLLRGTFVTAFFFPLMGYVTSAWLLIALRFLTAACAGTTAASQAMIARTTPDNRQGFALSMLTTSYWGGTMLGNVVGGLIIHYYDYRTAFWFCGILYFLAGFMVLPTRDTGDVRKAAARQVRKFRLLPGFSRGIWTLLALMLIQGCIRHFEIPFIALKIESFTSPAEAAYWTGIISAVVSIGAILSGIFTGYLADRLKPLQLLVPMLVISAITLIWQGRTCSIAGFTVSRTLLYMVCGGVQPVLQKLLAAVAPPDQRGAAFGFGSCGVCVGGMLAAVLGGWCMAALSLNSVFYAGGLGCLLGVPLFVYYIRRLNLPEIGRK